MPLTWQYCYDNDEGTELVKLLDKKQRALNPALAPAPRPQASEWNDGGRGRRRCGWNIHTTSCSGLPWDHVMPSSDPCLTLLPAGLRSEASVLHMLEKECHGKLAFAESLSAASQGPTAGDRGAHSRLRGGSCRR